jgi:hypothetical protein
MAKPAASRAAACETYIIPILFYFYSIHFTNVFILFYSIQYLINKIYSTILLKLITNAKWRRSKVVLVWGYGLNDTSQVVTRFNETVHTRYMFFSERAGFPDPMTFRT